MHRLTFDLGQRRVLLLVLNIFNHVLFRISRLRIAQMSHPGVTAVHSAKDH